MCVVNSTTAIIENNIDIVCHCKLAFARLVAIRLNIKIITKLSRTKKSKNNTKQYDSES